MKLTQFKALIFDCYGTLVDWETGMIEALAPLTARLTKPLSRDEILEAHARYESSQQHWTPAMRYCDLLSIVYKRLAEEWGIAVTHAECEVYGHSVKNWPAFSDSAESLQYLKDHYKLVILSNVDNASFSASNEKLGVEFDAIYTAEDVGSYKPLDRNYEYMLEMLKTLGIEKHEIMHTAQSSFHDHKPANRLGIANCWINRRHAQKGYGANMHPGEMPTYDFSFTSMADLVDAHRQAVHG